MRTTFTTSLLASALMTAALATSAVAQTTKQPTTATGSAIPDAGLTTPQTGSSNTPGMLGQNGMPANTINGSAGMTGAAGTGTGTLGAGASGAAILNNSGKVGSDTMGASGTGTSASGAGAVTGNTGVQSMDHTPTGAAAATTTDSGAAMGSGTSKPVKKSKADKKN